MPARRPSFTLTARIRRPPRSGSSVRPGAAGLVALLASGAVGCSEPPERPSIVLVLVDQLRADAVERWMPGVSALAAEGAVFEEARAVAPWTYPSVISMFSGLYPQQHGADGHPTNGRWLATFSESLPLVPDVLKENGYATAGFVTNPFLHTWNPFHEGFHHYPIDDFIGSQGSLRALPKLVWTQHMFADTVNASVREHFDAHEKRSPEFTYVHYIDVHGPWDEAPFPGTYEAATRWTDEKIVELYEYFHARYDGDMLFVVTSDHGQDLGDDTQVGEGPRWRIKKQSLHEFNVRIPLLVLPGKGVARVTVDEPCANIDLMPTLLEWAGLEPPPGIPAKSLAPALRGEPVPPDDRAVYLKMSAFNRATDGIVLDGKKYVRHFDPETGAVVKKTVFDLWSDPREEHALDEAFGHQGNRLLEEAETGGIRYPSRFEEPDDELTERLQGLGYLGGDE